MSPKRTNQLCGVFPHLTTKGQRKIFVTFDSEDEDDTLTSSLPEATPHHKKVSSSYSPP
jgi:hypothetical protein